MALFRTLALALLCQAAFAGETIRLKSRTIDAAREAQGAQQHPAGSYWLVQFDRHPGPELLSELGRRGFRVLSYVPDSSLMLAVPAAPDLRGLGVRWAGPLKPGDKLSQLVAQENSGAYLVMFQPGVDPTVARRMAREHGFLVHETEGLLPGHLLLTGNHAALTGLAAHDEVAYILPAGPEMLVRKRVYGCSGPITVAGPVADYALADSGWPKDAQGSVALQYMFDSMTGKLDSNVARSQVERAFSEWARYANVTFTPAQQAGGVRTIEILFATGAHGDAYPFTSIATLAHTFYPAPPNPEPVAGDMHLNDAETWGVGNSIDLFSVALHEAGHALGLGHSDMPGSVMYPYYKVSAGLTADDIAAVQALYGVPGSGTAPAPTPVVPVVPPTAPSAPSTPATPTVPASPGGDTTAPSLSIVQPNYTIVSTSAASLTVSGTASDNVGVTAVKWSTSTGNSGMAAGTSAWSATVPLLIGTNTVTIRAYDAAGNSGWRSLTVVRN